VYADSECSGGITRYSDIGLEFLHRRCCWPEVVLYRPILEWGPPLDEGLSVRWIGLHFFFSFELSYLKAAKKASLAGGPEVGTKTSCRPHFYCAEWSCVVLSDPPRLRIKLGKDWPVKSSSGKLQPKADPETGSPTADFILANGLILAPMGGAADALGGRAAFDGW
jgi:hypothetical protein